VTVRVVLVRPWTDAHGGAGCCGGSTRDGVCLADRVGGPHEHDDEVELVGEVFRRLRDELPDVDVQVVGSNNTAYLLPSAFRAVRSRRGLWAAVREANRATTAGAVLVDGERVGDITALGVGGVLEEVRRRIPVG
jgi:hypothetical protein